MLKKSVPVGLNFNYWHPVRKTGRCSYSTNINQSTDNRFYYHFNGDIYDPFNFNNKRER